MSQAIGSRSLQDLRGFQRLLLGQNDAPLTTEKKHETLVQLPRILPPMWSFLACGVFIVALSRKTKEEILPWPSVQEGQV